jgi:polysaccharide biosynthesis protein PslA
MPHPALKRLGAELAQRWPAPAPQAAPSPERREAERLAELAAAFGLFGLRIDLGEEALWSDAAEAYRAGSGPAEAPANDALPKPAARTGFPDLERRGAHLAPGLPVRLMQAVDWILLAAAAEFAALWGAGAGLAQLPIGAAAVFLLSAAALKAGLWLTDADRVPLARIHPEHGVGGLALGAILGLFVAALFAPDARAAAALAATLPVAAMLMASLRAAMAVWIAAAHRAGMFSETVVLIGATDAARRLAARAAKSGEARVVAVVDDRLSRTPARMAGVPLGGSVDDLIAWRGLPHVDRIVIALPAKAETRVRALIERLRAIPNRVDLLLGYEAQRVRGRGAARFAGVATACVSGRPHNHRRALLKRALDIAFGALLLAIFALPMAAIAVAMKLGGGPLLLRQRAYGLNNRVFVMLKFRTAPLSGSRADAPRATRFCAWLRRTRLDDLPQLVNVLAGDMSLIGPRPCAVDAAVGGRQLPQIAPDYAHRHRVKPGIIGWAHVNGEHGPLKSAAAVRRRIRLDLDYVAGASLGFDLQILVRAAFKHRDAGSGRRPAR